MKRVPTMTGVMTPFPYSIEADKSPAEARAMMGEHGIRHLPVMSHAKVLGMISERDLDVLERATRGHAPSLALESLCTTDPYIVDLGARLDTVALELARRQLDAALVIRGGKLVGILTSTDACRLLGETLRELFPSPTDDEVA